jgi:hypothetical protein
MDEAPVGAGATMTGSPMWSAGAVAAGQQPSATGGMQQVFLPGGTAVEELQVPPPQSAGVSGAPPPRAKTLAEQQAEADARQARNSALLQESASAASEAAKITSLKAAAQGQYKDVFLPSRPSNQRTDTAANRAAFVASLVAKLQQDQLNLTNFFDSEWTSLYGASSIGTPAYRTELQNRQMILQDDQKLINALDDAWQNSNAVDCYPLPWTTIASETACSKTCGPGKKTQTRAYQEPQNGGQACPESRETRVVDCYLRNCVRTVEPSNPVCVPGANYRASDKKCVLVSQIPAAQGCPSGYTYNSSSGKCTKTGYTSLDPTPPSGFTWNSTLKQFEKTSDPTWTCARPGFTLDRGILGFTYPPECVGNV